MASGSRTFGDAGAGCWFRMALTLTCMSATFLTSSMAFSQSTVSLSPGEDLAAAIKAAGPGTVLELAGGDYGVLAMKGVGGAEGAPVTLRSADPANPARLLGMDLREVSHLVLEDLFFDYEFQIEDKPNQRPFQVFTTRDLVIRDSLFDGAIAPSENPEDEGYPTAYGLSVRSSAGIVIQDNEFRDFYRGLVITDVVDVAVLGNDIHSMRMDGSNFAQVERVLIEGNKFRDFKRAVNSADHADMIQFWTTHTERPSSDIVIRDNVLNSGLGWYTQSIFMRNEEVDTGRAGPEMFYRNVTIENNVIINAHLHGITVGETRGLTIRNNSVLRNARSEGEQKNPGLWTPGVRIAPNSQLVEISRNVAHKIVGHTDQKDWSVTSNFEVQDTQPSRPGYYDDVFVAARTGNPKNLASFRYLPTGPLDAVGVGSSLLGSAGAEAVSKTRSVSKQVVAPTIRITPDPAYSNKFGFDAEMSLDLEGLNIADYEFSWDFGDGQIAKGAAVTHSYSLPGLYQIVLTLTGKDGSLLSTQSQLSVAGTEVLQFSAESGQFTAYTQGEPPVKLDLPLSKGPARLSDGNAVIKVDRRYIKPLFGASDFELKMRLRGLRTFKSAGELLSIHKTLAVSVNERGMVDVEFNTVSASPLRLYGGPIRIYEGNWIDLTFRYSASSGVFQVEADGKVISEGRTSGIIRPLEYWGLSLGNPFNNRKSFDGELESLTLNVGAFKR